MDYFESYYSHEADSIPICKESAKTIPKSAKYDVIIKAKATTTRIVDISNEIVRLESSDKGQITGKYYSGVHWDTVEATMLAWNRDPDDKISAYD